MPYYSPTSTGGALGNGGRCLSICLLGVSTELCAISRSAYIMYYQEKFEIVLAESYSILFASQVIFMALYIVFLLTHLLHTLVYRNGCSLFIVPGDLSAVRVTTRTFRRLFQFFRTLYSTSSYDKFSLFLACCICCVLLKLYFNNDMYVIIKIDPNSLYSIF